MPKQKAGFRISHAHLRVIGTIAILFFALLLLWHGNATSNQAQLALVAQVYFDGEYRIADGPWQEIVEGEHIPSTKGDVTLRGQFHALTPDGEYIGVYHGDLPVAFYANHIGLTIYEGDNEPYIMDIESPWVGPSSCGQNWTAYSLTNAGDEPIEILVHNPHRFGNETAIDELLANTALWNGLAFEKGILESGASQRKTGFFFMIVSLVIMGIALFSTWIHMKSSKLLWNFGLLILFAGVHFTYSASGISFWNDSIVSNTILLGCSMMLYMFFLTTALVSFLDSCKKAGIVASVFLGAADMLFFIVPMITKLRFYDTWFFWAIAQLAVNLVLFVCLAIEYFRKKSNRNWLYIGATLPLIAFGVDLAMTAFSIWKGGILSECVFTVLFAVAMGFVLRTIPRSLQAAEKAKSLELQRSRLEAEKNIVEAELKESRVAIMLSQIQPHFIYNTLGTIERMCLKDPKKANELVRNFSLYLRGNFSELDSVTPIRFADELKHVEYYVNIEKVRFPDMNMEYHIESTEFVLPALSVQPLVENAIKHGLMRLETGGTVKIHSYETPTHFCVAVTDDGVGFDPEAPIDGKKHVGLRNIRGRLKAMVNGDLVLESTPGAGTKATIIIPKEVTV